jgi:hypothetical protein
MLTAKHLTEFMGGQAAFISQKCTVEYCRARSGLMWQKLFRERAFLDALEICRWEAYGAVLVDVAVLVEAKLRPASPTPRADVAAALLAMVVANLERFPLPVHRGGDDPIGWADLLDQTSTRIAQAQLAAPKPAHLIGRESAKRVFEVLPIHKSLRGHDHELVQNNIRFNLSLAAAEFEKRADPAAILADIAAAA